MTGIGELDRQRLRPRWAQPPYTGGRGLKRENNVCIWPRVWELFVYAIENFPSCVSFGCFTNPSLPHPLDRPDTGVIKSLKQMWPTPPPPCGGRAISRAMRRVQEENVTASGVEDEVEGLVPGVWRSEWVAGRK